MACSLASDSPSWRATVSPLPCSSTRRRTRRGTVSPGTNSEIRNGPPTRSPSVRTRWTWGTATPPFSATSRTAASASIGLMIVSPNGTIVATRWCGHSAGRRLEQHVVAAGAGRRLRQVGDLDVLAPLLTEVGGEPRGDIDGHVTHLPNVVAGLGHGEVVARDLDDRRPGPRLERLVVAVADPSASAACGSGTDPPSSSASSSSSRAVLAGPSRSSRSMSVERWAATRTWCWRSGGTALSTFSSRSLPIAARRSAASGTNCTIGN